jgi:putative PIN family toxin of toxin-antitoxin system
MTEKKHRVIFDTNVWVSILIGKRSASIISHLSTGSITLVFTDQLLEEIRLVTARKKLRKYFPKKSVEQLIELIETIGENVEISPTYFESHDPKDNFLLDLIAFSKADFLVTGDKELQTLSPFKTARILSLSEFEKVLEAEV